MTTEHQRNLLYEFGPFRLCPAEHVLLQNGRRVPLTPKALEILLVLLEKRGHIVGQDELRKRVWAVTFVEEHTVAQTIFTLRKALGDAPEGQAYIETIPRLGYRFLANVQAVPPNEQAAGGGAGTAARRVASWRSWTGIGLLAALTLGGASLLGWRHFHFRTPAQAGRIMLAVLPFENLSGDPGQAFFSDGLTEEMISQLGRMNPERLGVIARTSAMHYKGTTERAGQIGQELRLDYLVAGSVRREGTRVRISAQLIRVRDETQVWAQDYDRNARDILALQSDVSADIAEQIELKLTRREQAHLAKARSIDPQAHEDYLRGRFFWSKRTDEGLRKAIAYLEEAIRKEPSYAEAHAGLADSYTLLGLWGMPGQDAWHHAKEEAGKALELDEGLAEAHASLGYIAMAYEWDWSLAEREFRRAIELNPSYAIAHLWYGYCLMATGRLDEAARELKGAQELDPLSLWINANVGFRLYFARQYDEAIEQWQKTLEMDPNFPLVHSYLALGYEQKHLYKEAVAESEKALALGGSPTNIGALGHIYGVMGKRQEALKQLRILHEQSKRAFIPAFYIAYVYVGLGDADQAFLWLDKACQEHSGYLIDVKMDPSFDRVRGDRRFFELLRRLNFPT